jgi:hypothetical protein
VPDYPHGRAQAHEVAIHQFGSGNAKIEQRYLLGTGARRFTIRRSWLRDADRIALRNFWESKYGPYGACTCNAPSDSGVGTTAYTSEPLSWEIFARSTIPAAVEEVRPRLAPAFSRVLLRMRFARSALQSLGF